MTKPTIRRATSEDVTQLAFYVNLHRAVIGPSATLTGRWRPDIDLRRMLTGQISLRFVAGWSESSLIACVLYNIRAIQRGTKREPLPYWVDVQPDLSLCWSPRSYCTFYCTLPHIPKCSDRQSSANSIDLECGVWSGSLLFVGHSACLNKCWCKQSGIATCIS